MLEPAIGVGNAWVRTLPRGDLLSVLRPYKSYLQTAALLCGEEEVDTLSETLFKSGAVRICPGERMSARWPGAPHDGEDPLRRYTKTAVWER